MSVINYVFLKIGFRYYGEVVMNHGQISGD